jgi:hypothetical protein
VFGGFPQVQSIRLHRLFQNQFPRLMDTMETKLKHLQANTNPEQLSLPQD